MTKPSMYDTHYSEMDADVYHAIRAETYGEDLGQTSWITAAECDEFCRWLGLVPGKRVLEIACGSGGVALRMARLGGAEVVGTDINPSGIAAASARAKAVGLQDRARFQEVNADETLPFADGSFDVVFCNDALNHLHDRPHALSEWHRVLRPGGRCLYTDPVVLTGWITKDELAARSSIGSFLFTCAGVNETLLRAAGLRVLLTADCTQNMADNSGRWHAARERNQGPLRQLESDEAFAKMQEFLGTVNRLSSERRLSRWAFMAEREICPHNDRAG